MYPLDESRLLLPVEPANYTDFYASIHHATRWQHVPPGRALAAQPTSTCRSGYHGRASSIIPSGAVIVRPRGQTKADDAAAPSFGPCAMLDYELEIGCVMMADNPLSEPCRWARRGGRCSGCAW